MKQDAAGGPEPAAWYDFENGSLRDRAGKFPDAKLFGNARIENGALVLDGEGDYFKALGSVQHPGPTDLERSQELDPGGRPFIESDKRLATCPNIFQFGDWHYYLCGSGSGAPENPSARGPSIPRMRLDNLAVPKTAAFGKEPPHLRRLPRRRRLGRQFGAARAGAGQDRAAWAPVCPRADSRLRRTASPSGSSRTRAKTAGNTIRVIAGSPGSIRIPDVPARLPSRSWKSRPARWRSSPRSASASSARRGDRRGRLRPRLRAGAASRVHFSKMGDSSGAVNEMGRRSRQSRA